MREKNKNISKFGSNFLFQASVCSAVLGALSISLIGSRFLAPFDVGHFEAFNWLPATHLLEGKNPYAYAFVEPYSMAPYGILYYCLLAPGVKLFGYQLWWGRALSVLALIGCLWLVYSIAKSLTRRQTAAVAALVVGLALFPVQAWAAIMRPDFIATALALACLAGVLRERENEKTPARRILLLALVAAAAFFVKQTTLLPVAIVALRFLQLKNRKAAAQFVAVYALCLAGGMLALDYTSDGGYVWQHFTHAKDLPFSRDYLEVIANALLNQPASWVFGLGLLLLLSKAARRFRRDGAGWPDFLRSAEALIFLYLLLSLAAALVATRRVGANVNYYIESSFAAAIAGGIIFDKLREDGHSRLMTAMLVLLTLGGALQSVRVLRGEYFRWQAVAYYREIADLAARSTPPGSHCVSVFPELMQSAGCVFHFDDFSEYESGWSAKLNDIFEREMNSGKYRTVVWNNDQFGRKFPNYQLVRPTVPPPEKFYKIYLYVWRPTEN